MIRLLFVLVLAIALFSCKKPEDRRCFKSWGKETSFEIPLENFNALDLREHMEFVLIQDSLNKVVVKAGENMVKHIEAHVDNQVLTIENKNKCRFVRKKSKIILVEIHFTQLNNIKFGGTEPMHSAGTIQTDYFTMLIRDGAGPVNLSMNAVVLNANIAHGYGDYTFSGTTQHATISAKSNGYCDATGLQVTDSLYVHSETTAPMKVNANNAHLSGYIKESGNVYYKGTPASIQMVRTGSGELLPF